jgi:hypothetical protein
MFDDEYCKKAILMPMYGEMPMKINKIDIDSVDRIF